MMVSADPTCRADRREPRDNAALAAKRSRHHAAVQLYSTGADASSRSAQRSGIRGDPDKIFEPFFTTDAAWRHRLGLTLCREYARQRAPLAFGACRSRRMLPHQLPRAGRAMNRVLQRGDEMSCSRATMWMCGATLWRRAPMRDPPAFEVRST